jgi:hypothetical protein
MALNDGFKGNDGDGVASRLGAIETHDDLGRGGNFEGKSGVIGGNRKLAAGAIDEHGQLDFSGAAMVKKLVERGFDGAAGEQHVVNQDHGRASHIDGDACGAELLGDRLALDVVAVKRNIESAGLDSEGRGKAVGQLDAAVGDTEEYQAVGRRMAFTNSVGQALNGGVNLGDGKAFRCGHEGCLCRPIQGRTSGKSGHRKLGFGRVFNPAPSPLRHLQADGFFGLVGRNSEAWYHL